MAERLKWTQPQLYHHHTITRIFIHSRHRHEQPCGNSGNPMRRSSVCVCVFMIVMLCANGATRASNFPHDVCAHDVIFPLLRACLCLRVFLVLVCACVWESCVLKLCHTCPHKHKRIHTHAQRLFIEHKHTRSHRRIYACIMYTYTTTIYSI